MSLFRYAKYIFSSPRLYGSFVQGENYSAPLIEKFVDGFSLLMPFFLLYSAYERNFSQSVMWVVTFMSLLFCRNLWRLSDPIFRQFLRILEAAQVNINMIDDLRQYDFQFAYFPVTNNCHVSVQNYVIRRLSYYLTYFIANTIAIRAIYPGMLTGKFMTTRLFQGRRNLVLRYNAIREKIQGRSDAGDKVQIDAMIIDRRNGRRQRNAEVLVICCEGNAGFYEIGMMAGALAEGYSVIGWNHPGFGGSSGVPYPTVELTAALAIMDYAVTVLDFQLSSILVYGWSIGAFPATYLASRYPNIKGLIIDAAFDHILPVAITYLPGLLETVVTSIVQNHINLDNTQNLTNYVGRIRIIRRVNDQIMAVPPDNLQSNRTSHLIIWYVLSVAGITPTAIDKQIFREWVAIAHHHDPIQSDRLSGDIIRVGSQERPSQGLIRIARSILRDYYSNHNARLPRKFFKLRRGA